MNFALIPNSNSGKHIFPTRGLSLTLNRFNLVEFTSSTKDERQARRSPEEWLSTLPGGGGKENGTNKQSFCRDDDPSTNNGYDPYFMPTYEADPVYFHNLFEECYSTSTATATTTSKTSTSTSTTK
eukprot:TRINITY_DN14114_c0_g1_i2.p1 TRINITY_DN14114_c0_g1~~TRINITY_DN14114_c0_g1_i2.p1  ORF type:complete len:126 (-),score=14.46 TRINITY_DN14114_c0_g1_i2:216-593(-)